MKPLAQLELTGPKWRVNYWILSEQIFEDGFFHADPHPGNLFVTPLKGQTEDGKLAWQLTFVDFGMVGMYPKTCGPACARR